VEIDCDQRKVWERELKQRQAYVSEGAKDLSRELEVGVDCSQRNEMSTRARLEHHEI